MAPTIGVLTAGGDSPGLNAAIRAVGKSAQRAYGMEVIGFHDGFLGLMQDRFSRLSSDDLSGILTRGGTILGTSRVNVAKIDMGDGRILDMTGAIREVVDRHGLEALVCLGGDGTARNAVKLKEAGIKVLTIPKTIDNDVAETDTTVGYDTAMNIATEAIDRLHSTAHSHHRIMMAELMGHTAGWLALGAGIAAGADVVLIPEIPYDVEAVASSITARKKAGSSFSIVAVAEGAVSVEDAGARHALMAQRETATGEERSLIKRQIKDLDETRAGGTTHLASKLSELTGLESRVTILGHVQRGGTPSPGDRLLATRLGSACADYVANGVHGVMVAARGEGTEPVPLEKVAARVKTVPLDHPWVATARHLGIALGD
jgi:6-phosphofructokinase 1